MFITFSVNIYNGSFQGWIRPVQSCRGSDWRWSGLYASRFFGYHAASG